MIISLIAGGWSFREVDHKKVPGNVVVVNDGLLYFRNTISAVVSMDRLWVEGRWQHLLNFGYSAFLRRSCMKNIKGWQENGWGWLHLFECDRFTTQFGTTQSQLNGRNSGACALNYVYLQRPTELYLFGFDMCLSPEGKAHWYPIYPWVNRERGATGAGSYREWANDFEAYARQFEAIGTRVYNVSPYSRITAWPLVSARELGCAR